MIKINKKVGKGSKSHLVQITKGEMAGFEKNGRGETIIHIKSDKEYYQITIGPKESYEVFTKDIHY